MFLQATPNILFTPTLTERIMSAMTHRPSATIVIKWISPVISARQIWFFSLDENTMTVGFIEGLLLFLFSCIQVFITFCNSDFFDLSPCCNSFRSFKALRSCFTVQLLKRLLGNVSVPIRSFPCPCLRWKLFSKMLGILILDLLTLPPC